MMLILKRPRLLLNVMEPATLVRILNPPDRVGVLVRVQLTPLAF